MLNMHDPIGQVLRKKIRELDTWIHKLETKGHLFDLRKLARSVGEFAQDENDKLLIQVVNHFKRKRKKLLRRLPEGKETTGTIQDVKSVVHVNKF